MILKRTNALSRTGRGRRVLPQNNQVLDVQHVLFSAGFLLLGGLALLFSLWATKRWS